MDLSPVRLDALFQALGDPTRRALIHRLAAGPATVSDLARPFDMTLPSFLLHIRKLEASGLVLTSKDGRTRTVTLVPGAFTPVRTWLDDQRDLWEARLDRLETFVTDTPKGPRT
ncbi:transcriptional regulator [Silicimonas algicola]|uniref:ArsR family transcriptional regulator n=1 Tax=Silicimonas algicola TaxID=1826607 RepID=A0A316G4I6_9RHOB|nr:metalloregulator ArsR/SmtB family transcription factor [Silicimonas algicola]AZQ66856.1 transcriptional regulator [Silicimonas algicola]PWK55235.1 ArsR family transcriptional regulator [Silicimonas algicola]